MKRTTRQSSGFTLVELTLAMAMIAMLALTLYTAMSVANRARNTATRTTDAVRPLNIAIQLIADQFASVLPPNQNSTLVGPLDGYHQSGSAGGDNDAVQFYALPQAEPPAPFADPSQVDPLAGGIRRVAFHVEQSGNDSVLVRDVTRNLLAPTEPEPEQEVLCRNVKALSFRYFDGTAWQPEWSSTDQGYVLPYAVQISLSVTDPQGITRSQTRIVSLPCATEATTTAQ